MQRYFAKEKVDNYFILNDDDIYHIKTVMRMKNNEKIEIVFENKLHICSVNLENNTFEILEECSSINEDKKITLVVPLLKEQKMDLVLQKCTELGASEIIPIITERSVVKLDSDKFSKKRERWIKICKEASEQSKRTSIPIVRNLMSIDKLNTLDGVKLVCSTTEKQKNLKFFLQTQNNCDKIVLAVGPEGGFTANEEERFMNAGFSKVSLGSRIMRVETVPIFVLSVLNYVYME